MSHSLWHPELQRDRTKIIVAVLVLMSCGTDDTNDPVLARAFDNELHWSDLRQVIPVSSTEMDSAALAQRYITNWSRDQVLVHRAEPGRGAEGFCSSIGRLSKGPFDLCVRRSIGKPKIGYGGK